VRTGLRGLDNDTLYIRMRVEKEEYVSFEISCDGERFEAIGETVQATPGRWVGVKAGLFAMNELAVVGGSVTADYFVFGNL